MFQVHWFRSSPSHNFTLRFFTCLNRDSNSMDDFTFYAKQINELWKDRIFIKLRDLRSTVINWFYLPVEEHNNHVLPCSFRRFCWTDLLFKRIYKNLYLFCPYNTRLLNGVWVEFEWMGAGSTEGTLYSGRGPDYREWCHHILSSSKDFKRFTFDFWNIIYSFI